MNRRDLLKSIGITAGAIATNAILPSNLNASQTEAGTAKNILKKTDKTRVIVCGGGFGGLTTAKYLKQFNPELEVILIEKNTHFISCPYSNVWLGEVNNVTLNDLSFDYLSASVKYGYEFVNEMIVAIDKKEQTVTTNNTVYQYDYLVLSPGIDYDYSTLFPDAIKAKKVYTLYPPAMKLGSEHLRLKKEIENFKGGNFIITVPSGTYRCPPAPYERACMVAYYFKKNSIKAKVVLLDPREKPAAKAEGFLSTFKEVYKDYIEYIPMAEIQDIDLDKKILKVDIFDKTKLGYIQTDIAFEYANIIPNMKPAKLIDIADLELTKKGWVKLKAPGFETVTDDKVYVVGDAGGHPYPKSGHMANSCAAILAKSLALRTKNKKFDTASQMPSNICYSMVNGDPKEGLYVSHTVSYDNKNGLKVKGHSTKQRDKATGEVIQGWYEGITSDIF